MRTSDLKSILDYDQETGNFTWKIQPARCVDSGVFAGYLNSYGYIKIQIKRKKYSAHRLAFLYMTGSFPSGQVDHINGVRSDNKWRNLRSVSPRDNLKNQKLRKSNTSGASGITRLKNRNAWYVQIMHNDVSHKVLFSDSKYGGEDKALLAAKSCAENMHKEFGYHENHGRR